MSAVMLSSVFVPSGPSLNVLALTSTYPDPTVRPIMLASKIYIQAKVRLWLLTPDLRS